MTWHWLELVSHWLQVFLQFLWLDSDSTKSWLDSDSTQKIFKWLYLVMLVTLIRQRGLDHIAAWLRAWLAPSTRFIVYVVMNTDIGKWRHYICWWLPLGVLCGIAYFALCIRLCDSVWVIQCLFNQQFSHTLVQLVGIPTRALL